VTNRIRIKDIALQAGVSAGTVDRVLHNRGEVSQATRDKILSLIQESDYTPNLAAKSLANRNPYRIAALIPEGNSLNPYWKMPIKGIRRAAREILDYNTGVEIYRFDMDSQSSFQSRLREVLESNPDGVVLAPVFQDRAAEFLKELNDKGIPCVLIDSRLRKGNFLSAFGQDTFKSGFLAARLMCFGIRPGSSILLLKLARPDGIIHHLSRRAKGFTGYFGRSERGKDISIRTLTIDLTAPGEPEDSLNRAMAEQPDLAGIFVTSSRASVVAEYLESRNKEGIILIGYDLTEANRNYLKKGTIDFLISQKPEDQGYNSIMTLCRNLVFKLLPAKIQYSPIDIITKENIDFYQT
jgi:LacI family transcriptional regulator